MPYINNTIISAIVKAATAEKSAIAASVAVTDAAFQKMLDVFTVQVKTSKAEFVKGNARTNEARREVGEHFVKVGEAAGWGESAVRNYQTSFWLCFVAGKQFDRNAFKTKAGGKSGASSGKVSVTSEATLIADAIRLINHMVDLGRDADAEKLHKYLGKMGIEFEFGAEENDAE